MNNDTSTIEIDALIPFTNFTDEEFKAKWNNVEYTFPPQKRVPMATLIPSETQDGIRIIRAKFARELGEKMWYQTEKFNKMNEVTPGRNPAPYTESDVAPFIQRCLEPLPVAKASSETLPRGEFALKTDNKGKIVTKILDGDESLLSQGSELV